MWTCGTHGGESEDEKSLAINVHEAMDFKDMEYVTLSIKISVKRLKHTNLQLE
jgi:predicted nucleic acid-binding protein